MDELFEQFIRERIYLRNVSPKTVSYYKDAWKAFKRYGGKELNQSQLNEFVVRMREAEIKPVSCNTFISGLNGFLVWLHECGHIREPLRIKKLKVEQTVVKTLSEIQIKAIISFKPQTFGQKRLHTLLCFLLDTGVRIEEALTLKRTSIDFDNLLVTVIGKGNKERILPIWAFL